MGASWQIDLYLLQGSLTHDRPDLATYGTLAWDRPQGKGMDYVWIPPGTTAGPFTATFTASSTAPVGYLGFDIIINAYDSPSG